MKNERKNLPRLLESVEGCFDEIHITDTGSTDGTLEFLKEQASQIAKCQVFTHHFKWVNSFCKARNASFEPVTTDYIMWMDADDVLSDKAAFIKWRDYAMEFGEMFFNTYNYALDNNGKPQVSFVRERVFKTSVKPKWSYDLHEGIVPDTKWAKDYAVTWSINHLRDQEDVIQDRSRNIKIIENMENKDARMMFYYGKELYEAGRPNEAVKVFEELLEDKHGDYSELTEHDRILAYQYAAYSAGQIAEELKDEYRDKKTTAFKKAIGFCSEGIKLDPHRAEFYVNVGDTYLKMGDLVKSIPYYASAKHCINHKSSGSPYEGAIYSFHNCYGEVPSLQLSRVYLHLGRIDEAIKEAQECFDKYKNEDAKNIITECLKIKELIDLDSPKTETEDIVFTCPPQSAYPFDEKLYKEKGMGGSETALIEMATRLKRLTGRPVKCFLSREGLEDFTGESGVEWLSNKNLNAYFAKNKPKVHIAWRHNIKLTKAYTYLWCHDLVTSTVEGEKNFDKILCLTEFHKNYVMAKQGVPEDMIIVTRNGITPEKFNFEKKPKNPNKILWMSSPDRGMDAAMLVCDEVKKVFPDVELHIYYGIDKLDMWGLTDLKNKLQKMMDERPYVKYHGFTEQNKMYQEVSDGVVWCHPCNFIETFCITAIEMLALGVYPVTRRLGALQNTLASAESKGQAIMLDHPCNTPFQIHAYAREVVAALQEKKWDNVSLDIENHSWEAVAKEWVEFMKL